MGLRRLLPLLALLLALWSAPAEAQGVGIFSRPDCTTLTSPVAGSTWCFDSTLRALKVYDGAVYATITSLNAVINVTDLPYGAKGDGVTDDTAAIQAAVTAAAASGGTVLFPGKTFKITTAITIPSGASGLTLRGSGAHPGLDFTGASGTILDNEGTGPAIDLLGNASHTGVVIEQLTIDSTKAAAAYPSHGIRARYVQNGSTIRNIRVRHAAIGLEFTTNSFNYGVFNSTFSDLSNDCIEVSAHGNAAQYIGNTCTRASTLGFNLRGYAVVVLNNDFELIGCVGVNACTTRQAGSQQVLVLTTDRAGFVIAGNYFEENGDGATAGRSNIFVTGGGSGGAITGNYVDAICSSGACAAAIERNVWVNNTSNVTVSGNHFRTATTFDVLSGGGGTGNTAWGNRPSGGAAAFSGITQFWNGTTQIIGDATTVAGSTPFFGIARSTGADFTAEIDNTAAAGSSFGLLLRAGGNSSDYSLLAGDRAGTNLFAVKGDGAVTVAAPTGGGKGVGTINAQTAYYANNNQFINASGTLINASVVFANLNLVLTANGMQIYCSDCTAAGALDQTCVGGGTGNLAVRVNGVFKCAY